jgi:hypothetical protein
LSARLGQPISVHRLNAWTAPTKAGHRFPFAYAAALEDACGSYALTTFLARQRGCAVLVGPESLYAELGKLVMLEVVINQQKRVVQAALEQHHAD